MSHSHEDRVAEHDPRQCSAYGCPMPGTMTGSTSGTSEWQCWLHFGRNIGSWQRISAELNRMQWLGATIVTLRRDYGGKIATWTETYRLAVQSIRAGQRSDLLMVPADESVLQWIARLEAALSKACAEEDRGPRQKPLVTEQPADTFARVGFEVPA